MTRWDDPHGGPRLDGLPPGTDPENPLSELRESMITLVAQWAYEYRAEPFELSSGFWSHDYIDAKRLLADADRLSHVVDAVMEVVRDAGVEFDAVGGLTMGADPLAVAIALGARKEWFLVRKDPKPHGKQRWIEGAQVGPSTQVLLVDDVVTTGRSILRALAALEEVNANVVMTVALVDRGQSLRPQLQERGIRYEPLITFDDLGIDPVPDVRVET